jgi:hypothetical protein
VGRRPFTPLVTHMRGTPNHGWIWISTTTTTTTHECIAKDEDKIYGLLDVTIGLYLVVDCLLVGIGFGRDGGRASFVVCGLVSLIIQQKAGGIRSGW